MTAAKLVMVSVITTAMVGCVGVPVPVSARAAAPSEQKSVIDYRQLWGGDPREYAAIVERIYGVDADSDLRTGTVIIKGSPGAVAASMELIKRVESPGYVDDTGVLYGPIVFMKFLQRAAARDLVPILEEITRKGGFAEEPKQDIIRPLFVADERTNALIIRANKEIELDIRKTIDELDQVPEKR